ncbi:group II intron reverse transcriptase/maturase [Roseimarinus sediminis]|uniref:group II intron reverse transcriptase/maturase n=1 Tax=Roseimarinus sediminis TaxID=1610899 RepID=UPI003D1FC159
MIEELVSRTNLNRAFKQVVKNGGSAGIDQMMVTELGEYLKKNADVMREEIREKSYQASPILGVEIPKPNGKKRLLGIPTVVDRVFQQAMHQVLEPLFEPEFQKHSYGFRPNRNAHQAIAQSLENINSGYQYIVDIDLKSFFDEVEHGILLDLIYKKVKCDKTLKLLRSFLRAPIAINGTLHKRRKGVPQGSPLSPLLSNILLNELDKELEKRQLRYVRYADDFSIYVRSKKAARRVGNGIYKFQRDKLKLPINREKSGICRPVSFTTLGFGFVPTYKRGERGRYQLVVEDKKWKSLKQKLKMITRKTTPMSFDERIERLNLVIRGWVNYFKPASITHTIKTKKAFVITS